MATFALRQGVDLKTIQTMLRHSRLATTADLYTHVLHEVQRSGSDHVGDLLTEHGLGSVAANRVSSQTRNRRSQPKIGSHLRLFLCARRDSNP